MSQGTPRHGADAPPADAPPADAPPPPAPPPAASRAGGLTVAVVAVALGAALVFGVSRMLRSDRSYEDLLDEMESRAFGNKWIAAYELSKEMATSAIPPEEVPRLIARLSSIYDRAPDARTRNFIVVALGSLRDPETLPVLAKGLADPDGHVAFHAIAGVAGLPEAPPSFDWGPVASFLGSADTGLVHAAVLALGTHGAPGMGPKIAGLLSHPERPVRHAAATALVHYQDPRALPLVQGMLRLTPGAASAQGLDADRLRGLKLNVLAAFGRSRWPALRPEIEDLARRDGDGDLSLAARAREVLEEKLYQSQK